MKPFAVRIYLRQQDGTLTDLQEEYDGASFANTVPAVGDRIVDPGVARGLNRHLPENRDVYEVVSRYFMPDAHDDLTYVAIVVNSRKGRHEERNLVTVS